MARTKASSKLMPFSEFVDLSPFCMATMEDWIRKKPHALPEILRIGPGGYRYLRRAEAKKWLVEHWAHEIHEIAFERGRI